MVDAINGNYGVKPQDTSINWNDLTANEVLEYEDEGQEVPEEVLAWAQDMAKTDNADDVTYEMSTSGEEQPQNAAQQLREEMSNNGVSLKQQGRQFIEESKNKEDLTLQAIEQMAPLLASAQAIGDEATDIADTAKTQLEVLKAQIESLAAEKNDKPRFLQSRETRGEVQGLQAVAAALGTQATDEIQGLDAELGEIDAIINEGAVSSQLSVDFGSETVSIGQELLGSKSSRNIGIVAGVVGGALTGVGMLFGGLIGGIFGGLFGSKKSVGKEAVEQGTETMTVGQQGNQIAEQAADSHGVSIDSVNKAEGDVASASTDNSSGDDTSGGDTAADTTTNNTQQTADSGETEELDPTLADTSITTDPDEILRRKERRGLA